MWRILVLLLHSATLLSGQDSGSESMIPPDIDPSYPDVRDEIVENHNNYRSNVTPKASNMLEMSWHEGAAKQAQAYADKCIFAGNTDASQRTIPPLGYCGQNLYASTDAITWNRVLKHFFKQSNDFKYGSPNTGPVGLYTQMVWSTTHKVGCGVAYCLGGEWDYYYNYVCNYCPAGNHHGIESFPYKVGQPCGDCPHDCNTKQLCTNACNYIDRYNNCQDLVTQSLDLCNSEDYCNATCMCGRMLLHKVYPW